MQHRSTRLSGKGQVVIPKPIRDARGWQVGLELIVEDTDAGVMLRPRTVARSRGAAGLLGAAGYRGPPKTLEAMDRAIARGIAGTTVIAIDTNVLVRLVTNDDPEQSPRAARLCAAEDVYVSKSVLLETEWVLRGAYRLSPEAIQRTLERLLGTPSVMVEDAATVERAVAWRATGMDFADALHLASSVAAGRFATFDRALARRAKKLAGAPGVELA